jgi:hypothetical protein
VTQIFRLKQKKLLRAQRAYVQIPMWLLKRMNNANSRIRNRLRPMWLPKIVIKATLQAEPWTQYVCAQMHCQHHT